MPLYKWKTALSGFKEKFSGAPTKDDYTSDMPEDQILETVKDIVHIAKKESQPWFNEISDNRQGESNDLKEWCKKAVENTGDN